MKTIVLNLTDGKQEESWLNTLYGRAVIYEGYKRAFSNYNTLNAVFKSCGSSLEYTKKQFTKFQG